MSIKRLIFGAILPFSMRVTASPFLEDISIVGAKAILVNIVATEESLDIKEYVNVTEYIRDASRSATGEDAHIITGVSYDSSLGDEMRITVIATGIEDKYFGSKYL